MSRRPVGGLEDHFELLLAQFTPVEVLGGDGPARLDDVERRLNFVDGSAAPPAAIDVVVPASFQEQEDQTEAKNEAGNEPRNLGTEIRPEHLGEHLESLQPRRRYELRQRTFWNIRLTRTMYLSLSVVRLS